MRVQGSTPLAKDAAKDAALKLEAVDHPQPRLPPSEEVWEKAPPPPTLREVGGHTAWEAAHKEAGTWLVVVAFTAAWCAPCKAMLPNLETLACRTPGALFLKVRRLERFAGLGRVVW